MVNEWQLKSEFLRRMLTILVASHYPLASLALCLAFYLEHNSTTHNLNQFDFDVRCTLWARPSTLLPSLEYNDSTRMAHDTYI